MSMYEIKREDVTILQCDWHRNGICGEGFYAILFRWSVNPAKGGEEKEENFLATLFDEPGACAAISLDRVEEHGVTFGANSWRGDVLEDILRGYAKDWNAGRIGPFSAPVEEAR